MKRWNRIVAAAAALALMAALTGCQSTTKDATVFVKGELDATYLGTYDQEYIDVVKDMTEKEAKEKYDYNVEQEADILMDFLSIDTPSDKVTDRAREVVSSIYSHAKYTVAEAEKLKSGDIAVEVTISPIEVLPLITDEYLQNTWFEVLEANGIETQEQLDEQFEAMDEAYALTVLDELERLIDDLTYGEDQVVMLQMKKDNDGYYSLVESGWQKLDEIMIDYYGSYAK